MVSRIRTAHLGELSGQMYSPHLHSISELTDVKPIHRNPYQALRAYNSGECSTGGNLNCAQYGTPSYVNDIANRLIGWDGTNSPQSKCGFPAAGCT